MKLLLIALPEELGYLSMLEKLYLNNNHFTGQVPELSDIDEELLEENGLNLNFNNLSTIVSDTENTFIDQKSSDFKDWKTTQNLGAAIPVAVIQYLLF